MTVLAALSTVARFLHLAGTLSFVGTAVLRPVVMLPVMRLTDTTTNRQARRRMSIFGFASLAVAGVAGIIWLLLEAAELADASSASEAFGALGIVAFETVFGHAWLVRAACLLAAGVVWQWPVLAAALALGAAASQAGMGHAIASQGWLLPVSTAVHVAAAGAWLGALVPLAILIHDVAGPAAARAASRFTPLGMACVALLAATAFIQARALVGGWQGFFGAGYGEVAGLKLLLFGFLIAIAAINYRWLSPQAGVRPRPLIRSIVLEAVIGLAVVGLAARLSQMDPGAHASPEWPSAGNPNTELMADPAPGRAATR